MTDETFDEKVKEIEDNMKVFKAYDKIHEQIRQVDDILKKGEEE